MNTISVLSYDQIARVFLISIEVTIGVVVGYGLIWIGVRYSISKENEIIKDLEQACRVLKC